MASELRKVGVATEPVRAQRTASASPRPAARAVDQLVVTFSQRVRSLPSGRRLTNWNLSEWLATNGWVVVGSLAFASLLGAVLPLVEDSIPETLLVATAGAAPLLVWIASRHPGAAIGLVVAVQPLSAFQFATPIGNPSPSIVLLAFVLAANGPAIRSAYNTRPLFRTTLWVLVAWVASYALRVQYEDAGSVGRQMITLSSFVAAFVAAAALADRRHVLAWSGAGAIVALSFLGVLGMLASAGVIPLTSATSAPRELFGFLSPFTRNYGLAIPNDSIDVLFPLALGATLVGLLRPERPWRLRFASALGLIAVSFAALFVFQSRSMIAQFGIALLIAVWVTEIPFRKVIIVPALVLLVWIAFSILEVDPTGTALHGQSVFGSLVAVLQNPLAYLVGQSENHLFLQQAAQYGLVNASDDNATHNLFLSNLVGGGYVAFLLICIAYFRPVWILAREVMRGPGRQVLQVLAVAAAAMLLAVSVEPVRATVLGNWLVLGFIVGSDALRPRPESRPAGSTDASSSAVLRSKAPVPKVS